MIHSNIAMGNKRDVGLMWVLGGSLFDWG